MNDDQQGIGHDVAFFALSAAVILSLAWFANGINNYVTGEQEFQQLGAVVLSDAGTAQEPLVVLLVSPGIVTSDDPVRVTWTLSRSATSCAAVAAPVNELWAGQKPDGEGVHTEEIGALSEDTTFSIECTEANGRKSVSSMAAIVR